MRPACSGAIAIEERIGRCGTARYSLSHFVLVKVAGALVRGKGITKRLYVILGLVAACARAPRSEVYS